MRAAGLPEKPPGKIPADGAGEKDPVQPKSGSKEYKMIPGHQKLDVHRFIGLDRMAAVFTFEWGKAAVA